MSTSESQWAFHTAFRARKVNAWWTDTVVRDVILEPVRRDGSLSKATHLRNNADKVLKIRSLEEVIKDSGNWRDQMIALFCGDPRTPRWRLHLDLDRTGPSIDVTVLEDEDGRIREQFAGWLQEWSRGLESVGCDLKVGYMGPTKRPYPRPRPPLNGLGWPLGYVEMYLGRRWHRADEDRKDVFDRILAAPLVPGLNRIVKDDVLHLSVDCDLRDEASVERARVLSERWLTPLVPTKVEPGWNEFGDKMIVPGTTVDKAPFTFFDEGEKIGYWALLRDPEDGSVDEKRWKKLAAIARAGKLDDGTEIASVRLIAAVRSEALALRERAKADGFEMVTYPQGNGGFWNVVFDGPAPA